MSPDLETTLDPKFDPALDPKVPAGPMAERWTTYKFDVKLVNPANKRRFEIIIVGTGLAGAAGAATLAELGYKVKAFTFHDSPRRAHSIAAQGGINAAKNYRGDGDSGPPPLLRHGQGRRLPLPRVERPPARRGVRQHHRPVRRPGRALRREYGGLLDNRSFGGAQVSRTFYARGQTVSSSCSAPTRRWPGRSASATSSSSPAAS